MSSSADPGSHMQGEFLVLASTPNEAKLMENHLRGAGHPVRFLVAPGLESFADILAKSEIQIAIYDEQFQDADLIQVVELVNRHKPDVPVMVLTPDLDAQHHNDAMSKGANGIVSVNDTTHLELVCKREYRMHELHRNVAALRVKLAEAESARAAVMGSSDEPMLQVQEGIVIKANRALARLLGVESVDDLFGLPMMDLVTPQYHAGAKERIKLCLKGKDSGDPLAVELKYETGPSAILEARLVRVEIDGEPAIEIVGLPGDDAESGSRRSGGVAIERRALCEALDRYASKKDEESTRALVMIRVDDFPALERQIGFTGIEDLMDNLIELIDQVTESDDRIFRFAMNEVVVLGRREDLEELNNATMRFQRALARYIFKVGEKEIAITTSAVIYPLPEAAEDPEVSLRNAREAVDALESEGGGLKVSGSAAERLEERKKAEEWVDRIRQALKDGRFELAYQNIASLTGDERQASDVLVRMIDEDGQEILAREFIRHAEESGLMVELDRWVIGTAIRKLEELDREGKESCFFVRIAEQTLSEVEDFHEWIADTLKAHPIGKNELVVTLREKTLQGHMKKGQWLSSKSGSLGVSLAIDHFGITRHSAQLLSRLPIQYVKLHADFTEAVSKPGTDMKPLEGIMEAARQNSIKTIAERVSDANSMARLWQLGINYIMGSHVHEPDTSLTDTRFRLN